MGAETVKHVHPDIEKRIAQSEKDGGVDLANLHSGRRIEVQTKHTLYIVTRDDHGYTCIEGHADYCPTPVRCQIHGSTWGTPMIKVGFIGVGMQMEYSTDEHRGTILTSTILSATVKDA